MIEELRPSSYENELYLGDMPGTLQIKKKINDFISIDTDPIKNFNYTNGYFLEEHSFENLKRLTPNTKSGKQEWKILLIIKKIFHNKIILKGALINKDTNQIALITSFNNQESIINKGNKVINSLDYDWFIGQFRMSAPMFFWNELKNRINYSL